MKVKEPTARQHTDTEQTEEAAHLHLVTDAALGDAVGGSSSGPQVGKALDGQGVAAVTVPGHFEVQVTVV